MQLTRTAKLASLSAVTLAALLAQSPAPSSQKSATQIDPGDAGVLIRSTTRLIQVNVVVHDRKGQPVKDLKKEDFKIFDNGKPQTISVFSMDSSTVLPQAKPLPQNVFTNKLAAKGGVPTSTTVILLDAKNTKYQDQAWSRRQVVKYLATLKPEDRIAIYSLTRGLTVLHDFTSDSSQLLSKLEKFKGYLSPDGESTSFDFDPSVLEFGQWMGNQGSTGIEADYFMADKITGTLKAIEFIANHLAELPGRKNLIWVSGGFPISIGFESIEAMHDPRRSQRTFGPELDETIRALNNANVAIYPVDSRGLTVDSRFSAEHQKVDLSPKLTMGPTVENQMTMSELASRTGGHAYMNTNDLTKAIHDAVADSAVSYTLGYYPADEKFDGKFHKLDIKTPEFHGMNLRYRKGYFDQAQSPQDENRRHIELRDAVYSPLDSSAVGLIVQFDKVDPQHPGDLNLYMRVDPTAIGITPVGDRSDAVLDVIFNQRDGKGKSYKSDSDTISMSLKPDSYKKLMQSGLIYHKFIPRVTGATELRVVVRDASSGATGSVTIPLKEVKL